MDRRPLWRYYLLVNDEKCHVCMYVCMYVKWIYFHVNDMQWNMDNEDLDEKRLVRWRDISYGLPV